LLRLPPQRPSDTFATGCKLRTFVVADLHFGDEAVCTRYRRPDGSPLRPFASAAEMDGEIVRRWNQSVTERDLIYVLGDVGRGANVHSVRLLAGRKRLIAGNGDNVAAIAALGVFENISIAKWLPGILLTHIPVHPSQLRRGMMNIHGHIHAQRVSDPRYICVSLEQTDFQPVLLDELLVASRLSPCRTATGR
jgi:calcineurin-like phosphoesterase family protein